MPERIVEYKIITMLLTSAFGAGGFALAINEGIKEGWQPYGEAFIILDERWQQINQPMIKYNKGWGAADSKMLDNIKQ